MWISGVERCNDSQRSALLRSSTCHVLESDSGPSARSPVAHGDGSGELLGSRARKRLWAPLTSPEEVGAHVRALLGFHVRTGEASGKRSSTCPQMLVKVLSKWQHAKEGAITFVLLFADGRWPAPPAHAPAGLLA